MLIGKPLCGCTEEQESLAKASVGNFLPCYHCQNATEINLVEKAILKGDYLTGQGIVVPPSGVIQELPNHFAKVGISVAEAPAQMIM